MSRYEAKNFEICEYIYVVDTETGIIAADKFDSIGEAESWATLLNSGIVEIEF